MDLALSPLQARIIGCLIEKEVTTPDQYPLSLNALTLACNQKSNREPVMNLSETEVQSVVDELAAKHLVRELSGSHMRVPKYKHRFCNTEFGELRLDAKELAIIDILLLRGPQTPGELRTRTARLCNFRDAADVEAALQRLTERELVSALAREPGKRERRYAACFGGELPVAPAEPSAEPTLEERVAALEADVAALKAALAAKSGGNGA